MAWNVDTDNTFDPDHVPSRPDLAIPSAVGTRSHADLFGETYRFRILDGDGNVYFRGSYDVAAAEADEDDPDGLYALEQWAARGFGATSLEVYRANCPNGIADFSTDQWVAIFG